MTVVTNSGESEESTTAEVAADALDQLVGQTIDGRFRIVDVIGKGAMGKVYRAVQLPLNRAVALKVLDSTYGAGRDESFRQRFLVEAALTAKLNHPNTVRVVDYGSTKDGLFFFAMEYLDGETLEKLLSRGALPWHRVLSIGQQMARALREAHELGVVHRDLKPANVVMLHADDDTDFVKVLDFGLVKSFVEGHELEGRAITQQGMLMGSPPYMAPEQGEKNRADPRSDIYSLGTMLYEMLCGRPPYTGGGALEVILKHVNEPIPPVTTPSKFEAPPDALSALVTKCLAKSPMDRFQSMEELLLAMQDVSPPARSQTQDLPVSAPTTVVAPPQGEEPLVLAAPPRSPSWMLVGGFFVAAVVGVLGTWMLVKPASLPTKLLVHIDSTPSGATVSIDGSAMGVTPLELEQGLLDGRGSLELKFEKSGFGPSSTRLIAGAGRLDINQVLFPVAVVEGAPASSNADAAKTKAEAAKAEAARTEAAKAEAAKAEAAKAEAAKAEAAKAAAAKAEAAKAEAAKAEAAKAEAAKAEAAKAEAAKAEAAKTAAAKADAKVKADAAKAELAKAEAAKQEAARAKAKADAEAAKVAAAKAEAAKISAPVVKTVPKVDAKKKPEAPVKKLERPASKLDEDDAPPAPTELKRPTSN